MRWPVAMLLLFVLVATAWQTSAQGTADARTADTPSATTANTVCPTIDIMRQTNSYIIGTSSASTVANQNNPTIFIRCFCTKKSIAAKVPVELKAETYGTLVADSQKLHALSMPLPQYSNDRYIFGLRRLII